MTPFVAATVSGGRKCDTDNSSSVRNDVITLHAITAAAADQPVTTVASRGMTIFSAALLATVASKWRCDQSPLQPYSTFTARCSAYCFSYENCAWLSSFIIIILMFFL